MWSCTCRHLISSLEFPGQLAITQLHVVESTEGALHDNTVIFVYIILSVEQVTNINTTIRCAASMCMQCVYPAHRMTEPLAVVISGSTVALFQFV